MKQVRRRFGATLLAVALTLSLVPTSLVTAARAAMTEGGEEPSLEPYISATGAGQKPTLHIDFLGDGLDPNFYGAPYDYYDVTNPMVTVDHEPAEYDLGLDTHATPHPDAYWSRYDATSDDDLVNHGRIFWVGIGVDKVSAFELAKNGGLYSAEFGLYYNTEFVEPVISFDGTDPDFPTVIYDYNMDYNGYGNSVHNLWDPSYYEINAAGYDLDPVGDPETEEFAPNPNWRMLYTSVQRQEGGDVSENRFYDLTDADLDDETYYLMMIPFRLMKYDPAQKLCFRLARNASLFSVGSGETGEALSAKRPPNANQDTGFGAWERETRNPGHNLKEMFDFEGDLNIFTGKHEGEKRYDAELEVVQNGSPNGAKLSLTGDPTIFVDETTAASPNTDSITDLTAGTSMTLELTVANPNFTPAVTVKQKGGTQATVPLTPDASDPNKFTFVMPDDNVKVTVTYVAAGDNPAFDLTLYVVDGGDANNTATVQDVTGGGPQLTPAQTPVPVVRGNRVEIKIPTTYNTDYDITVTAKTTMGVPIPVTTDVVNSNYILNWENGGSGNDGMPPNNVDVTVTYTKAKTYRVQLVIDADLGGSVDNKARLHFYDGTGTVHDVEGEGFTGCTSWLEGLRPGREVVGAVNLHQNAGVPDYQIKKITLFYTDPATVAQYPNGVELDHRAITAADITADGHLGNPSAWEELITMPGGGRVYTPDGTGGIPAQDIAIKVEFERIGDFEAKLHLVGADNLAGNTATLRDPLVAAQTVTVVGTDVPPSKAIPGLVRTGTELELTIQCAPGYRVDKVEARRRSDNTLVTPSSVTPTGTSLVDFDPTGVVVTFRMPGEELDVTVTYERENNNTYWAHFLLDQNPAPATNAAAWVEKNGTPIVPPVTPRLTPNYAGDSLKGEITVQPGWYIDTIEVVSETGATSYPFSYTGSGYNNGAGGTVTLTMDQPADNVYVKVTLKQGPPTPTPNRTLNLVVVDADDKPGNNAHLEVNGTDLSGAVRASGGTGSYSAPAGSINMGDLVHVPIACESGYYVDSVVVTPVSAGVTPTWVSDGVEFTMPAGGVTVTVTYKPIDPANPPIHKVTLHTNVATQPAGNTAQIQDTATPFTAANMTAVDGGQINTYTMHTVEIDVTTSADRKAVVYAVMSGGASLPLLPVGTPTTVNAGSVAHYTFIAPSADADVYVDFVDASTPTGDYTATLTVIDAQGGSVGQAGSAQLDRSGSGVASTGTVQSAAAPGNMAAITANTADTMTLTVTPQAGYSVQVAYVTPSGAATLSWSSTSTATFPMPNRNVGVVVIFHKAPATPYNVELIIRPGTGVTQSDLPLAGVASLGNVPTAGIYNEQHPMGDLVDFAARANSGYYIQSITVTPAPLGITPTITGTTGTQTGDFTMPAADVYVNVTFAKGYPDTAEYDATLRVIDPSGTAGGTAQLKNTDLARLAATAVLHGGQTDSVRARTGDVMEVEILANAGYVPQITVTDHTGASVSWQWTDATHIRFDMAGGPTLVEVKFVPGTPEQHRVTLHVTGQAGDWASIELSPAGTPNTTVTVPGASSSIQAATGDTITVKANHGTSSIYLQSVVVMEGGSMLSINPAPLNNTSLYTGDFTVPNGDVDVYVNFAQVAPPPEMEYPAVVTAVGLDGSASSVAGKAWIATTNGGAIITQSPDALSNDASQQVMAAAGTLMRVHGDPNTGYTITGIHITPAGVGYAVTVPLTWVDAQTVEFTMPAGAIAIEVDFDKSSVVPNDLIAQVTVDNAGNTANTGIIHQTADPAVPGQVLIHTTNGTSIDVDVTVAPGYEVEYVELRTSNFGNSNLPVPNPTAPNQTFTFSMLPENVVVFVKIKRSDATTFTATLNVVDTSSAFVNSAKMTSGTTTVTGTGAQITGLADGAAVDTELLPGVTPWPSTQVRLVKVIAEDRNGVTELSASGSNVYPYAIDQSDVTITVIYADVDEPPEETTYIAKVVKDDPNHDPGNMASIHNTANTALPHGTAWTEAWPGHGLQVDVTAASGYYVEITAKKDSDNSVINVAQLGQVGNVTAYLSMPNVDPSDVTVTVKYIQGTPTPVLNQVEIDLVDNSGIAGNSAILTERATPANTATDVTAAAGGVALPNAVQAGSILDLSTVIGVGAHVASAVMETNGVTVPITLSLGAGSVTMPTTAAKVIVTVEAGTQTPRPYDRLQDPSGNSYINGYLKAQNLGGGRASIRVPFLYDGARHNAMPSYTYELYIKSGAGYIRLVPGVDYEVTDGYESIQNSDGGTGTRFTIRSLQGNSSLTDWLVNGGVIYITATEPGKTESEFVEVELPADPGRGEHKATLRIIDFSQIPGNGADMSDGVRVVSVDGGILDHLQGSELIKTDVTVAPGAVLTAVTVTDSTGTRPLSPDAYGRYPYDMTGEDIIITVYFDDEDTPPDPELYIATVQKAGLHGVAGNDADIHNATRNDLPRGTIWAAGYAGNDMTVDVDTAAGYYAVVTAYPESDPSINLPVVQMGAGSPNAATHFEAYVSIPDGTPVAPDDVRVVVTFTKDPPPGYDSQLTLTLEGTDGPTVATGNVGKLTPTGMATVSHNEDGSWLVPDNLAMPATPTTLVTAGTALKLETSKETGYYVDSVVVTVAGTPGSSMTLTLNSNGDANFTKPLGATDVKVVWKKAAITPRPFDYNHQPMPVQTPPLPIPVPGTDVPANATKWGWILAEHTLNSNGDTTNDGLKITVPSLHDENTTSYEHAINTLTPSADITYRFYTKDQYGVYHELISTGANPDIRYDSVTMGSASFGATAYNTITFELTSLLPASTLHYYIKHGGVIYVTAEDTGASTTTVRDESDYTEVIIPANYTATLIVREHNVTGNIAKLTEDGQNRSITAPPTSKITGLNGTEKLSTIVDTLGANSHLVSVIATTASNQSIHIQEVGSTGVYDYTMVGEDVTIEVVFQADDDPFGDMYTATVQKVDPDNRIGNKAEVVVNETVSGLPSGAVWTAAYRDNVIRVDVETEPGYYAVVTAKTTPGGVDVPVVQWAVQGTASNPAKSQFYMPTSDVDVTVTFTTTPPPPHDLKLTLVDAAGLPGNTATLSAPAGSANTVTVNGSDPLQTQAVPNQVSAGTVLTLTTAAATGYTVKEAKMVVTTAFGPVTTDVPLTDGTSLPLPVMPLGDTEIIVTYETGHKTPRPYDPNHANVFTPSYQHNTADDLSSTHQDGWILATPTGSDSLRIIVPTLHDKSGATVPPDKLFNAGNAAGGAADQPTYKLYWRDTVGAFQPLTENVDITVTAQQALANGTAGTWAGYDAYQIDVKVKSAIEMWGGYTLSQYLQNGGSIYITATGTDTTAPDRESEKTEVVIPFNKRYTATLIVTQGTVTGNVGQLTEPISGSTVTAPPTSVITDLYGTETLEAIVANAATGSHLVSVIVTTASNQSVHINDNDDGTADGVYHYTMNYEDVTIELVFQDDDDPLGDMYTATVYKIDPDQNPGNKAEVIVNETVSTVPTGSVWTGAYKTNVVRVDVETAPGYYAYVTAKTTPGGVDVPVIQWALQGTAGNPAKSQFYMPDSDVDVTVTFSTTPPDNYGTLFLTLDGDTDNNAANTATLIENAVPGNLVTVNGTDSPLTKQILSGTVVAGQALKLTTAADTTNHYAVVGAKMKITVPVGGGATATTVTVDIPLTNGVSLPLATMPYGDAEVIVTYVKDKDQTPRPFDPHHATDFDATYPSAANPDRSATHQDGWLLAVPTDVDQFHLVVPTLHDMAGGAPGTLYPAGDTAVGAAQPVYKLYWRDTVGAFHEFFTSDITISNAQPVANAYNTITGYEFDVKIVSSTALWGGYTLDQYLRQGGSIYITATGTAPTASESEKTEVVIPKTYVATLHIQDVSGIPGSTVVMTDTATGRSVNTDGARIANLAGNETINTLITPATGVRVVGVAIYEDGTLSRNLDGNALHSFDHIMAEKDVDVYVVLQAEDDPLKEMWIATATRDDPADRPGNTVDLIINEDVSPIPHAPMWTGAYGGNVVRVDVTAEPGYYAIVTAKTRPGGVDVPVVQWGSTGSFSSQLYMPESHVDVTVTFTTTPPQDRDLFLTLKLPTGGELLGNTATVTAGVPTLTLTGNAINVDHVAVPGNPIPAGQAIHLTTGADIGYSVDYAEMEVTLPGNTTGTPDFTVSVPLTDGASLPDVTMPLADAEIKVYFKTGSQTPRPYDPHHANIYDNTYDHNVTTGANPDLSATHQDGWLLAETTGTDSFRLVVPVLHDKPAGVDTLHSAGDLTAGAAQPKYKFYWRDNLGAFQSLDELVDIDIISEGPINGAWPGYDSYVLDVKVHNQYERWGGYHLSQYLQNGGSIYITATGTNPVGNESEKTEVVFVGQNRLKATLHIVDPTNIPGTVITMTEVGGTQSPVTTDGGQLIDLMPGTTVNTHVAPIAPGVHVAGVVATTYNGTVNSSVNLIDAGGENYDYIMGSVDVDIYVILQRDDDPPGDMYIAAVQKVDPDNKAGNKAQVIVNESKSDAPTGPVWVGAYVDNVIRVEAETEQGYYATVTAVRRDNGQSVPVVQWAVTGTATDPIKAQFYMPAADVDVTVTFSQTPPTPGSLKLTLVDAGNNPLNSGTLTELSNTANTVTVLGSDAAQTQPMPQNPVAVGSNVKLTTTADTANAPWYAVKDVKLRITVPVGAAVGAGTSVTVDVPITDGASVPPITMPLGDAEVIVTFHDGVHQTPRPYDPHHAALYDSTYNTSANPDLSTTGQEGWLLAAITGTDSFHLLVPTLHDLSGTNTPPDQLFAAGDASTTATVQPATYKLYWRDSLGTFRAFEASDIDITNARAVATGAAGTWTGYDGWEFDVTVKNPIHYWGGYTLSQYLQNGGTLYITATGPNTTGTPADVESEKTEIVIPGADKYKATLVYLPNGGGARMDAWNKYTIQNAGVLTGSNGTEVVKVSNITANSGWHTVGVVATTASGSVNATPNAATPALATEYTYTMVGEDVTMRVVFAKDDDPLQEKGPHIVTVYKVDHDNEADNTAAVTDLDVAIPAHQRGDIWTVAYEDNAVQVDVTTAAGYYAVITATRRDNGQSIQVAPFTVGTYTPGAVNQMYGKFYMPADTDVDVTVTYINAAPPAGYELKLTTVGTDNGVYGINNGATLTPNGMGAVTIMNQDATQRVPDASTLVPAGTELDLHTFTTFTYHVLKAEMVVNGVSVAIPLTDGNSLPISVMPMGDTEVIVTFEHKSPQPRPYDPHHAPLYDSTYQHTVTTGNNPDLSQTHQDGWIQASDVDAAGKTLKITVPTLHDNFTPTGPTDPGTLHNARVTTDQYKLYWKDNMGNFNELTTIGATPDISMSNGSIELGIYTNPYDGSVYDGYTFTVTVLADPNNPVNNPAPGLEYPTLWGGYSLLEYMQNGGSIYISTVDPDGIFGESEKTEVVIPAKYRAGLHFDTTQGSATMDAWNQTANTDGQDLFGSNGTETVTVRPVADPGYVVVGVVATTTAGTVNANDVNGDQSEYTYTMVNKDVDMTVVYNTVDDPLKEKGPHIVTVIKVNDDGYPNNDADVTDLDVVIPAHQQGDIWTAAYEGNTVQVDVTTEPGYYPIITAVRKSDGASVPVAPFMTGPNDFYGKFYMPADSDVDVTVEFVPGVMPDYDLTLTVAATDGLAANKATVTIGSTGVSLNADGQLTPTDGPVSVMAGESLTLTTDHHADYSVLKAVMKVQGVTTPIDIPLTDGESLPIPLMPMADAEIVVTFQHQRQMPRPYDPHHATVYDSTYQHNVTTGSNPDLSQTHQDGWLMATDVNKNARSFAITVPVLHDKLGPVLTPDMLYDAVEQYKLYWKDSMGVFQPLTVGGPGQDISIIGGTLTPDACTWNGVDYDSFTFQVRVNADSPANPVDPNYPTLWGGYTVWDYIKTGGSLYISALDDTAVKAESELTEVVIPNRLTAQLVYEPNGDTATMTIPAWNNQSTSINDDILTGADPAAVITVDQIVPDPNYFVVGVVAETLSGSVNATDVNGDKSVYEYTMVGDSVVMRVIFNPDDDPLKTKGPHIVTVYKVGDDGEVDNSADVTDLDVVIPANQQGDIWTVAYEDNTVQVDVGLAAGYYAVITAIRKDNNQPIQVAQFVNTPYTAGAVNSMYGKFYMPEDTDVDVTVTYVKSNTLPEYELSLTTVGTGGTSTTPNTGNKATLEPDSMTAVTIDGEDKTERVPDATTTVAAGTDLTLTTGHISGYSVLKAEMVVSGVSVTIPLTDGEALPIPVMPMGDTEVIVTFQNKDQIARPYDPNHSEAYNSANYEHNETTTKPIPDVSQTHQEGWILGVVEDPTTKSLLITVPTLHDNSAPTPGHLESAVQPPFTSPEDGYKLYWKDYMGNFNELTTAATAPAGTAPDVKLSDGVRMTDIYEYPTGTKYDGYQFKVTILADPTNPVNNPAPGLEYPTLWGGYTLLDYINNGGSIYISALDPNGVKAESELTEVVILAEEKDLQPYDPENVNDPTATPAYQTPYEDHWITSENRGDSLVVTVPMLNKGGATDNSAAIDVDPDKHTFHLYLTANAAQAEASWTYESLEGIFDVSHPDPTNTTDPYENDVYYTDTGVTPNVDYNGARYILKIKSNADIDQWVDDAVTAGDITAADAPAEKARLKELAQMVGALMDNAGTTEAIENGVDWNSSGTAQKYRLFITHKDITENPVYESDYVDFEIPRYFAFKGLLESYAPKHAATFSLYPLKDSATDPLDEADYEADAVLSYDLSYTFGTGLLTQSFSVRSSHLMGRNMGRDGQGKVYKLVVEKPGHVTYTLVGLELTPDTLDATGALTFTLDPDVNGGVIALIGGDFDGNGANGVEDLVVLTGFMGEEYDFTRVKVPGQPGWDISTYNPESLSYAVDLDGDGTIGAADLRILNDYRNFRQTDACYQAVKPQLKNAAAGTLNGGAVVALMALEPTLPQWLNELLLDGVSVPDWVVDMAKEGKKLPAWVEECVKAEKVIPAWAAELVQAEKAISAWVIELIRTEEELPDWAKELMEAGKALPEEPIDPNAPAEPELPDWAKALIEAGEELPDWAKALIEAGQALPEEPIDPSAPVEPVDPTAPEEPTDPEEKPGVEPETPEEPTEPTDPEETPDMEPETPVEPAEPTAPEAGEELADGTETGVEQAVSDLL